MVASDRRRLDELRLFTAVQIEAHLGDDGVVVDVAVTETLRLLPVIILRVTDENGVSAGPGMRAINLLGHETQSSVAVRFGGETAVTAALDATTITPGTWMRHLGFSYSQRRNTLYDFDERATSADVRHRSQPDAWSEDRRGRRGPGGRHGILRCVACLRMARTWFPPSARSSRLTRWIPPRTRDMAHGPKWRWTASSETHGRGHSSWTDGDSSGCQSVTGSGSSRSRRFRPARSAFGLPDYLQFALGGANSVRGWRLGSRRGPNQFIGTFEYTYVVQPVRAFSVKGLNLYGGLQLVGFADVGLTSRGDSDEEESESAIDGYGVGLRLLVPYVDVIRLDVAWGEPGRGATGYFSVSLKASRQRQRVR